MNRFEQIIVFGALMGQVIVVVLGFAGLNNAASYLNESWFNYLGIATFLLSICAMVLILRDLYKRQFENPNSKLTWLLIMMFTGGIGLVIYIFRHAVKPRGNINA